MAWTNDRLTDEVKDLKARMKAAEQTINVLLWEKALKSLEEG